MNQTPLPEAPACAMQHCEWVELSNWAQSYATLEVQEERERCAKLCESMEPLAGAIVHDIARAIRKGARNE